MNPKAVNKQNDTQNEYDLMLRELDKGINNMEAGQEFPLEDAFKKITELRDAGRTAI